MKKHAKRTILIVFTVALVVALVMGASAYYKGAFRIMEGYDDDVTIKLSDEHILNENPEFPDPNDGPSIRDDNSPDFEDVDNDDSSYILNPNLADPNESPSMPSLND